MSIPAISSSVSGRPSLHHGGLSELHSISFPVTVVFTICPNLLLFPPPALPTLNSAAQSLGAGIRENHAGKTLWEP